MDHKKEEDHWKNYFQFGEVINYFFRKKDPDRKANFNLRIMHGVNKLSIIMFLIAVIILISTPASLDMNIEEYRNYCLQKPGTTEEFPFDNETLVFKVGGKMYALCNVDFFESINLKCDPEKADSVKGKI